MSLAIPFEKQLSPRQCGAAVLSMVYRALGLSVPQAEIWQALTPADTTHGGARTHRLAADAHRRGFAALVLQALDPWSLLDECRAHEIAVILNHRSALHAWTGHYSVLVQKTPETVVVHDPHFGPNRRLRKEELLHLWQRNAAPHCEISGNVLVAISRDTSAAEHACDVCQEPVPAEIACPGCAQPIPLKPARLVGCIDPRCSGRRWERLFCAACDRVALGEFSAAAMLGELAGAGAGSSPLGNGIGALTAGLDRAIANAAPGEGRDLMAQTRERLGQLYEELMPHLRQRYADRSQQLAELQGHVDELPKQAKPAHKPLGRRPPKPAATLEPIDPALGEHLRKRLLHEIQKPTAAPTSSPDIYLDVWEDMPENPGPGHSFRRKPRPTLGKAAAAAPKYPMDLQEKAAHFLQETPPPEPTRFEDIDRAIWEEDD